MGTVVGNMFLGLLLELRRLLAQQPVERFLAGAVAHELVVAGTQAAGNLLHLVPGQLHLDSAESTTIDATIEVSRRLI